MSADPDRQLTSIQVSRSVRDRVRQLKRGQQTYDDLLEQMAEQYEPEPKY